MQHAHNSEECADLKLANKDSEKMKQAQATVEGPKITRVERVQRVPHSSFVSGSAVDRRIHVHNTTDERVSREDAFDVRTSAVTDTDNHPSAGEETRGRVLLRGCARADSPGSSSVSDAGEGKRTRLSRIRRGLCDVAKSLRPLLTCTRRFY